MLIKDLNLDQEEEIQVKEIYSDSEISNIISEEDFVNTYSIIESQNEEDFDSYELSPIEIAETTVKTIESNFRYNIEKMLNSFYSGYCFNNFYHIRFLEENFKYQILKELIDDLGIIELTKEDNDIQFKTVKTLGENGVVTHASK